MRSRKIDAAYAHIAPDDQTRERIFEKILQSSGKSNFRRSHPVRTGILIAACIALLTAGVGGYAAYQKWKLPKPETYDLTEQGNISVHSAEEYTQPILEETESAEPLSDEDFIRKAAEILDLVCLTEVDKGKMTVSRHEDMHWSREEVEVLFTEDKNRASVKFNANTGALLGLTNIDWIDGETQQTDQTPEALARHYYELLPVPQGYELTWVEQYDDQFWSHDFCRKVDEDLYNEYEMVRISVNPLSGNLCNLVVFDVPLLDDHEPNDVPITQKQADEIARGCKSVDLSQYELEDAKVSCVFPNWHFSDYPADGNLRASAVTRLGWSLVYSRESEFSDEIRIYIDYYTGEILGGDTIA